MSSQPKLNPGMWPQRHGDIERRTSQDEVATWHFETRSPSLESLDRTHRNVVATFALSVIAVSDRPKELEPAKAIASIPIARIEPRIVLALSHLLNSRSSFGVILWRDISFATSLSRTNQNSQTSGPVGPQLRDQWSHRAD
jgi:hypothetical protein